MTLTVSCPRCATTVPWDTGSPWRPFCSRRCRDEDFCAWANEEHVIAEDPETSDLLSEDPQARQN